MASYVRDAFYLPPPPKNSTVEQWQEWMRQDALLARSHKASITRATKHADNDALVATKVVKFGGVWKQATNFGFSGDADEGTLVVEAMVNAVQDQDRRFRGRRGGVKSKKTNLRRYKREMKRRRLLGW